MYNKFRLWAPPFFHFLECILALAFYTSTVKGDNPFLADLESCAPLNFVVLLQQLFMAKFITVFIVQLKQSLSEIGRF